jgi:hypothetical protein
MIRELQSLGYRVELTPGAVWKCVMIARDFDL